MDQLFSLIFLANHYGSKIALHLLHSFSLQFTNLHFKGCMREQRMCWMMHTLTEVDECMAAGHPLKITWPSAQCFASV